MASVVDISNLALAHLGDEATVSSISPSDGSAQADHCVRFYPIARDLCLERHDWNFARRRTVLSETANTPPEVWEYEYAMPSNVIRVLAVLDEDGDEDAPKRFMQGTDANGAKVIWSNEENATLLYTHAITDTTKFSALFVDTLAYMLAGYLAGPITKDMKLKQSMMQIAEAQLAKAALSSANANRNPATHNVDWVSQRGYVNPRLIDGKVEYE